MEKEVFLQGLHCSSLTGVETAAWSGCTRVEISGTALNCLLLVTGFHQPGFKMFAASLKPHQPFLSLVLDWHQLWAPFHFRSGCSWGVAQSRLPIENLKKENKAKQERFNNRYGGHSIQVGNSPPSAMTMKMLQEGLL